MSTGDGRPLTGGQLLLGVLIGAVLAFGLAVGGAVADGGATGPVGDEAATADDNETGTNLEITPASEGETVVYSFEDDEILTDSAADPSEDAEYAAPEPLPDGQTQQGGLDPEDDRERVEDPWDADEDHRAIVQILMTFPDGDDEVQAVCSGAIVGEYQVLTAGHCIYDGSGQLGDPGFADRVEVRPAADAVDDEWIEHFGVADVRIARTYEGYVDNGAEQHDFALLTLDRSVGEPEATGTLEWESYDENDPIYDEMTLINHGYPGTPPQGAPYPSMWGDTGSATVPSTSFGTIPDTIEGSLHGAGGHSGSPFYHETDDGDHEIVGVLAYGPLGGTTPMFGPRVTHTKSSDLDTWIGEDADETHVDEPDDRPEFVFENLTFVGEDGDWFGVDAPDEVAIGNTEIDVDHRIRNVGTATGPDEIDLVVRQAPTDAEACDPAYDEIGSDSVSSPAPFEADNVTVTTTIPGDVEPGEVGVCVTVDAGVDEFDTYEGMDRSGVETITVVDPSEFQVSIDETSVADGNVTVDYTVENVADDAGTQDVVLEVDGEEASRRSDLELGAGETHVGSFAYDLAPGDHGELDLSVSTRTDADERTVDGIEPAAFDVEVSGPDEAILEGDALEVDLTLENTGDVPGERTIGVDAGPLGADEATVSLEPNGTAGETLSIPTADGDVGSYLVETAGADSPATDRVDVRESLAVPDGEIGDATGDGEVDLTDAIRIQQYLVGLADDDEVDLDLADLTRDGEVGLTDAIRSQQLLVDLAEPGALDVLDVDATTAGDNVTEVTALLTNAGDVGAVQAVELAGGDDPIATTIVDVAPGEYVTVTFTAEVDDEDAIEVGTEDDVSGLADASAARFAHPPTATPVVPAA